MKGAVRSCGCLRSELSRQRLITHGHNRMGACSGEYHVWYNMKTRCLNERSPAYRHYGARGISVCDRWLAFENFLSDMGPRPSPDHTLEREDNDGDYEPKNCRWATPTEQARNKRTTLRLNGRPLVEICEERGVRYQMVRQRWYLGIRDEERLFAPSRYAKCERNDA